MKQTPQQQLYKDDLVNRIGGMVQYDMTILEFCCSLRDEKHLRKFYGNFDTESFLTFQRETLDWAFCDFQSAEERERATARVMLRHHRLIQEGLGDRHYDTIEHHFVDALRHSWVDEEVIEIVIQHLKRLRTLFATMAARVLTDEGDDEESEGSVSSFFSEESPGTASVPSSAGSTKRGKLDARRKLASLFRICAAPLLPKRG